MAPGDDREVLFRRIYAAHFRQISAYAFRRASKDEAEDAVAETFLVAWRRFEEVPGGELTLPWLYGVARRVLSEGRRSRGRRERLLAKLGRLGGRGDPEPLIDERLTEEQVVHLALSRLRPHDREILRLAEWEDLTNAELAVVFGCSVNAVTIRLHRAHRRFEVALRSVDQEASAMDRGVEDQLG
jgi:RNA polymerase sigma-70 factor (ECF subfamily)